MSFLASSLKKETLVMENYCPNIIILWCGPSSRFSHISLKTYHRNLFFLHQADLTFSFVSPFFLNSKLHFTGYWACRPWNVFQELHWSCKEVNQGLKNFHVFFCSMISCPLVKRHGALPILGFSCSFWDLLSWKLHHFQREGNQIVKRTYI